MVFIKNNECVEGGRVRKRGEEGGGEEKKGTVTTHHMYSNVRTKVHQNCFMLLCRILLNRKAKIILVHSSTFKSHSI